MITPYLEDFAEKYKDQLYVYKVDVDQEKGIGPDVRCLQHSVADFCATVRFTYLTAWCFVKR